MLKRASKIGLLLLAIALAVVVLSGCSAKKPAASAQTNIDPAKLVGTWTITETQNQPASLSDLTLRADGTFRYAGRNALGGPVAFGGRYKLGIYQNAPWIELFYDDYPDRATVWYFRMSDNELQVSPKAAELGRETALRFVRKR
jgi:hypothetical protein